MLYRLITYLKFLCTSTDQHGVHSPFVFKYLTRGLYIHEDYKASKSAAVLLKSIKYFKVKSICISDKEIEMISLIVEKFPFVIFNTPPYDMVFSDIADWPKIKKEYSESPLFHGNTPIMINHTHKSKQAGGLWKIAASSPEFNVTIDMFWCGLLFPRMEQRKEHFKVRI